MVVVPPRRNQPRTVAPAASKLVFARGPRLAHGGPNASARAAICGVGGALAALLEFIGAVAGENRMRVRIHESRHHDAPPGVDHLIAASQ